MRVGIKAPYKAKYRRGRNLTKPGSLLRSQIPISTETWNITVPGFVEADTVAHSGSLSKGPFVSTLTITDIATQWTENRAVWAKVAANVVEAIRPRTVPLQCPFLMRHNGGELMWAKWVAVVVFEEEKRGKTGM